VLHNPLNSHVRNCRFLDYSTFRSNFYSKTPYGNTAWIRLTNTTVPLPSANKQWTTIIENCFFDEGAGFPIHIKGGYGVLIRGCYGNVGSSEGPHIENVDHVQIEGSVWGYSTSGSKKGLTLKDVRYARLEGFTLQNDVNYIELSGTTQRVDLISCDLQAGSNGTYPTGIYNPAGAEIRINGVRQKNGLTQIGS
jgi:hypothetical protein